MTKDIIINKDIIKGNWKEIRGHLKEKWGKLTDDDLMTIEGGFERIGGILQQKYGYQKEQAKKEAEIFLDKICKQCKK